MVRNGIQSTARSYCIAIASYYKCPDIGNVLYATIMTYTRQLCSGGNCLSIVLYIYILFVFVVIEFIFIPDLTNK